MDETYKATMDITKYVDDLIAKAIDDRKLALVINCKDCKRDLTDMCMMIHGDNGVPRPNDYCSYGEHK